MSQNQGGGQILSEEEGSLILLLVLGGALILSAGKWWPAVADFIAGTGMLASGAEVVVALPGTGGEVGLDAPMLIGAVLVVVGIIMVGRWLTRAREKVQ